jgi:hypothetical protein
MKLSLSIKINSRAGTGRSTQVAMA